MKMKSGLTDGGASLMFAVDSWNNETEHSLDVCFLHHNSDV